MPTADRGMSSMAILRGGELLLFDAGEGMQKALIKAKLGLNRKTKIFITHLHGDHCVGLIGLLQTMSMVSRDKTLEVYGPQGIASFVKGNMKYLGFSLAYPLVIHEVKEEGVIVNEQGYRIRTLRAEHSIPTLAYVLQEKPRPGIFSSYKARKFGVPEGHLWSSLQHGKSVKVNGRAVKPRQVVGPSRSGRVIGISGDTRPSPRLTRFFSGAHILIFDATYGDEHADKAVENTHSTAREAATVASKAGAGLLILTHFSSRYEDVEVLVKQAKEVHPKTIAAHDFLSLEVPYPD